MSNFLFAFSVSLGAMFPIINPIGHAPLFYVMTLDDTIPFRRRIALKSSLYTFLILLVSLLLGNSLLRFFGISLDDLRIAGGFLVAATAWNMLHNSSSITESEHSAAEDKEDISLTPLATPILSGPGAMSLAIGMLSYGSSPYHYAGYVAGFAAVSFITWLSFRFSESLIQILSVNALGALNRILGFFIMAIGVDLIMTGIRHIFLKQVA